MDDNLNNLAENTWSYDEGKVIKGIKSLRDYSGFDLFLQRLLQRNNVVGEKAFEVGICPGNVISVFHNLGFEINGIDNCAIVELFTGIIQKKGFKVGHIYKTDFEHFVEGHCEKYDLVYSCGFVEHFVNFKGVIRKHMELVKDGGFLLITVPNFAYGLQYYIHKWFDNENLSRHYLPSMNPKEWEKVFTKTDFVVLESGYAEYASIWIEAKQSLIYKMLSMVVVLLGKWFPANRNYSPVCYILARKNEDAGRS